ncbi:hypothetical protein E2C01_090937 [Portunus trituberculatus]|uniref:Uncharacterized protein n=1 Tax=Portunus trituberculatus TaxID=210409 RepID=A0A5B7JMQ2_PORTR|nr:hypothetical protein [Portunus trituberculatus]
MSQFNLNYIFPPITSMSCCTSVELSGAKEKTSGVPRPRPRHCCHHSSTMPTKTW